MFSFKYKKSQDYHFEFKVTFPDGWKRYHHRNCAIFEERYSRYTSDDDITNVSNFWFMSYCTPIAFINIQESSFYGTSINISIDYQMYRVSQSTIAQISSFLTTLRKEFNLPNDLSYEKIKQYDLDRKAPRNKVLPLFKLYDDDSFGDCSGYIIFWDDIEPIFYEVPKPTVEII